MSSYTSGAELKDMAKCNLERKYGVSILVLLTVAILENSATLFLSQIIPAGTFAQFIIYSLCSFLLSAFLGIFKLGTCLFFLNMACGQPYKLDQLFYGFQNNASAAFTVSLVQGLLSLISTLPFRILLRLYVESGNIDYLWFSLIAFAVGFVIQYPISLALSQSFYLLLDFPEYTGKQALAASCKIMKKHMWRLFCLQLSFLPLMFICILTFSIGFLWLVPYMNMTYTLFFLDIMKSPAD